MRGRVSVHDILALTQSKRRIALAMAIIGTIAVVATGIALTMRYMEATGFRQMWLWQNRDFVMPIYTLAGFSNNEVTAGYRGQQWATHVQRPRYRFSETELRQVMGKPRHTIRSGNLLETTKEKGEVYLRRLYQPFPEEQPAMTNKVLLYSGPSRCIGPCANALFWVGPDGDVYAFHVGPS